MTYPSGRIVTYAYDAIGRVSGVTTKANSGATAQTIMSGVTYLAFGPLSGGTFGNGLILTKSFDSDYFPNQIDLRPSSGSPLISRYHPFSDFLNLTGLNDNAVASTESQTFTYDDAQRLKTAVGIYGTRAYAYDLVGNRTSEVITPSGGSAVTQTYSYPSTSNKLASITQGATTLRAFTYDAAGNVTVDSRSGVAWNMTINKAGRISAINQAGTAKGAYAYDGRQRLSVRTVSNTTPSFTKHIIHDLNDRIIVETDGTGAAGSKREYIWLNDMPIAVVDNYASPTGIYYVHADHLNRPQMMTNASKTVIWKALYEPFGQVSSITSSVTFDMRFPGQWFQLEAGLTYNWHRAYDASMGRYTQPDPLGYAALRSDGPSAFGYAGQSPLVNVDPDGIACRPCWRGC